MPYLVMQDGAQIYYEDRGSGETLVFLHGLTASHRKIQGFINEFLGQYRCVSIDLRGHGSSNDIGLHMNLSTLAQDVHEVLEYLDLTDVTMFGHSLGGAVIFSYVAQYNCARLKRLVNVDMTPCARNHDWSGGFGDGKWTDDDFMEDMDRYFNEYPVGNWIVTKELMMPALKALPPEAEPGMILTCKDTCECTSFTAAGLWFSTFRTDNRPAVEKITVPFMQVLPETSICGFEAVEYLRNHVKSSFEVTNRIPGTSHMILMEAPQAVAEAVKIFLNNTK